MGRAAITSLPFNRPFAFKFATIFDGEHFERRFAAIIIKFHRKLNILLRIKGVDNEHGYYKTKGDFVYAKNEQETETGMVIFLE